MVPAETGFRCDLGHLASLWEPPFPHLGNGGIGAVCPHSTLPEASWPFSSRTLSLVD